MWSNSNICYLELALPSKFKIFGQFGPGFWHFDVVGTVSMVHLYGYVEGEGYIFAKFSKNHPNASKVFYIA